MRLFTILLTFFIFSQNLYAGDFRYIKVLIISGSGGIYNGSISISELEVLSSSGVNYALTSLATASSYRGVSYPSKSIDNNPSTLFATEDGTGLNPNGSQWLVLDLGQIRTISSVKLSTSTLFNSSALTAYRILGSSNGSDFSEISSSSGLSPTVRTDSYNVDQTYFDIDFRLIFFPVLFSVLVLFFRIIA